MIEEDDPEITVDTVEDTENFSDDADDDIKNIGGSLVPVSNQIFKIPMLLRLYGTMYLGALYLGAIFG